jgi:hypothetical protein
MRAEKIFNGVMVVVYGVLILLLIMKSLGCEKESQSKSNLKNTYGERSR